MSNFTAEIQAKLNTSGIAEEIKKIESNKIEFQNISLNTSKLVSDIQSALNKNKFTINLDKINMSSVTSQMQKSGTTAGKSFSSSFNNGLAQIKTTSNNAANTIQHMQRTLASMKFDRSSIDIVTKDLQSMELAISNVTTRINGNNLNLSIRGVDELGRAVTIVKQFDYETGNITSVGKTISQSFDTGATAAKKFEESIKAVSNGSIEASISKVDQKFSSLSSTIKNLEGGSSKNDLHNKMQQIETDLKELHTLQQQMSSGKLSTDQLVSTYEDYRQKLAQVNNSLTVVQNSTKQFASETEVAFLKSKMESWLQNNTKAASTYGEKVQGFITRLSSSASQCGVYASDFNEVANAFKNVDKSAEAAGLKGKTFGDQIKGALSSISRYFSISTLLYSAFNAIKGGIEDVIALDTALVDLEKTSNATATQLNSFYLSANDMAKQLGSTTQEIIQAAADWSRLGYSLEDAQTMAKTSSIFASISPEMDISTATDGLVSAMKAFDIEAEDALDGIASKINAVGNTQAVDNQDIVTFITKSASAMAEANNSLEETIALGTAATEITRDADAVGNALKTVSMRIRGYDEETEEYVGGIEELSGDIADLTKTASTPGGISLFTDADKTEYKSTTQLLREISEVYDELTDKQQADLLEKLAGKHQGQNVAAILSNFDAVESSLATMSESAGGAMDEMEIIQDSLEYKINALKETGTGIFQNLFQTDDMGNVISVLTGVLNIVDELTSKLGLFGTASVTAGIVALIKNFDKLKLLGIKDSSSFEMVEKAIAKMSVTEATAALATTKLEAADQARLLVAKGLSEEEAAATVATATHSAAVASATTTTTGLTGATNSLKLAVNGLKTAFLTNPITAIITAALTLITVVSTVKNAIEQSAEESRQAVKDAAQDITNSYESATESISSNLDTLNGLEDEFNTLSSGVDDYGNNISLTSDEYERYKEIVQEIVGISPELIAGYDSEGNAIANKNGLLEQSIALMNEELRLENEKITTDSSLKTLFANSRQDVNDAMDSIDDIEMPYDLALSGILVNKNGTTQGGYSSRITDYIEKAIGVEFDSSKYNNIADYIAKNIDSIYTNLNQILNIAGTDFVDEDGRTWKALSDSQVESLRGYIIDIKSYTDEAKAASDEFNSYLQLIPESMEEYSNLDDSSKGALTQWIKDSFAIDEDTTDSDIKQYADKIRSITRTLASDTDLQGIISDAMGLNSSSEDSTVEEYQKKAQAILSEISNIKDSDSKSLIESVLGLDVNDSALTSDVDAMVTRVKNILHDGYDDEVAKMSLSDLKIAYNISADADSLSFEELQERIEEAKGTSKVSFADLLGDEDSDFSEKIDDYCDKVSDLKEALSKIQSDDFDNSDLVELIENFPELAASDIDSLDEAITNLLGDMNSEMAKEFDAQLVTDEDVDKLENYRAAILALSSVGITAIDKNRAAYQNLVSEQEKIENWGLSDFGDAFDTSGDSFIQTKFGNVDMDKRTIIAWSDELKNTYAQALASWDYDPEVGSIDTVFGASERFGEDILEAGVEVAFTPIMTVDGETTFLDKDTVYEYIEDLVGEATSDGVFSEEKLLSLDQQGKQIGDTFVQGIIAATDEGLDYENNGNWAETVGRLMHFSGEYGAIALAYKDIATAAKEAGISTEDFISDFQSSNTSVFDETFVSDVDEYVDKVTQLQSALEKLNEGELENEDVVSLIEDFPQLASETDNLGEAIQNLIKDLTGGEDEFGDFTGIYATFQDQFNKLNTDSDREQLQNFMDVVLALGKVVGNTEFAIDIDAETDGMENLYSAMKESVSATGLTAESIENLKSRYQSLDNYDASKLFEKTANGIHLNTKALRELESEYEKQEKANINSTLDSLIEQYNTLTEKINVAGNAADTADLYSQRQDILDQINDTATLAAQYEGLTSAFHKWEEAQSIGEEGDMYDSLTNSLESVKELYDDGLIGTNKFRTAVQLMSNKDLSTASVDELLAAYEAGYPKMTRYFTDSQDGCLNFLNDVQNLNSEWVKLNEDGSWDINFGTGNDQEVADALGINVESVQSILRKLSDYGFDINLDSIFSNFDLLQSYAEKANDTLKELGATDYTFNFNTDDLTYTNEQIDVAKNLLDQFRNEDGTVNLELDGAEEAQTILTALLTNKQSLSAPAIMSVDTTQLDGADTEISNAITLLQQFVSYSNDLEIKAALGVDTTDTQQKIQDVAAELSGLPEETKVAIGIDGEDFAGQLQSIVDTTVDVNAGVSIDQTSIDSVISTISSITPAQITLTDNASTVTAEITAVDEYTIGDKSFNVTVHDYASSQLRNINSYVSGMPSSKSITITTYTKTVGLSKATGTANVRGTAMANGYWGVKNPQPSLGGELGQELIVRNGHFFTIGDDSAEFFSPQKDDIIFNADQTAQIFKYGKIKSGAKRGRTFASGTAYSGGSGKITGSGSVITKPSGGGSSSSSSSSGSSSSSDEEPEVIDWIETAIDRIERAIDKLKKTAESTYKSLKNRSAAASEEISKVNDELSLQKEAYDRYIQQADSVGLSSDLVEMVQNGTIDISEYDSETSELIDDYQEWYAICHFIQ